MAREQMTARPLTAAEVAELRGLIAKMEAAPWWVGMAKPWDIHTDHATKARLTTRLFSGHSSMANEARGVCALRNHAESLLAATDENARLRAEANRVVAFLTDLVSSGVMHGPKLDSERERLRVDAMTLLNAMTTPLSATSAPEQGDGRTQFDIGDEAASRFLADVVSEGDREYFTVWTPDAVERLREAFRAVARGGIPDVRVVVGERAADPVAEAEARVVAMAGKVRDEFENGGGLDDLDEATDMLCDSVDALRAAREAKKAPSRHALEIADANAAIKKLQKELDRKGG